MNVNLFSVLKVNALKGIKSDQLCVISKDIVSKNAQVIVQPTMTIGDLCKMAKNTFFPSTSYVFTSIDIVIEDLTINNSFTLEQAKITDGSTVNVQFTVTVS